MLDIKPDEYGILPFNPIVVDSLDLRPESFSVIADVIGKREDIYNTNVSDGISYTFDAVDVFGVFNQFDRLISYIIVEKDSKFGEVFISVYAINRGSMLVKPTNKFRVVDTNLILEYVYNVVELIV